jgi:hypothetical protein
VNGAPPKELSHTVFRGVPSKPWSKIEEIKSSRDIFGEYSFERFRNCLIFEMSPELSSSFLGLKHAGSETGLTNAPSWEMVHLTRTG